jgi:cytochrome c553
MISHDDNKRMMTDYVLGRLGEDAMVDVESHLSTCDNCSHEFNEILNAHIVSSFVGQSKSVAQTAFAESEKGTLKWLIKASNVADSLSETMEQTLSEFLRALRGANLQPAYGAGRGIAKDDPTEIQWSKGDPVKLEISGADHATQFIFTKLQSVLTNQPVVRIEKLGSKVTLDLEILETLSNRTIALIKSDADGRIEIPIAMMLGRDITFVLKH